MSKFKRTLIILPFIILLLVSGILCFVCYNKTEEVNNFLKGDKLSANLELVENQKNINKKLRSISNEKKYTLKDAYVEINPYKISPLSAIIIFQTKQEVSISVTINDKLVTTMEKSRKHIIPIYGLYENFDNVVKLSDGTTDVTYNLKTEPSNIEYPLNVEYKSETLNGEEMYFTSASLSTFFTGWDIDGKLRFYLNTDNRMDVEWLSNGHFLIGTTQDQTREQFVGFVEMDYLGKIYNYYTVENGYSFEFQVLSNGNYMLAGGNEAIYMDKQMVWEINPADGKKVSEINIYDIVKAIDPEFSDKYLGAAAIRNGFYYNEETKELVVSFREINTLFSFNYETKTLNYVFTNPNNPVFTNPVWKNYFVSLLYGRGRYPLGQHTPSITKEGYLAFFNNGYDRYSISNNLVSEEMSNYNGAYSSLEIYDIKNKKARLVWNYDNNKSLFSIKYGLFRILDNGNKLADFGYVLEDDYKNNPSNSIKKVESQIEGNYALILEMDAAGNTIFKATSNEGKYRVFKHSLYQAETLNTNVEELHMFNSVPDSKIEESNYNKIDIKNAEEWIYSLDFTKNTFTTNYEITESDSIDLLFVNKTGKIFILNYKDKDVTKLKRVFNANLANGEYALYIRLNGIIYKTNKVYKF